MKNVVLIIKTTLNFILSLLSTWKNSFFKKKENTIIPIVNPPILAKNLRWKSISMYRNVRVILLMLVVSGWTYGQSIFTNPITGTLINANPYSTGQVLNGNITSTGIGIGAGTAQSAANDRYNVSGVNTASLALAITGNDYFEFSITPNACKEIDFTSLVYTSQLSTGTINLALRSSVDNYATNIATSTSATGATFSLTAASLQNITSNITFRLYVWGATAGGTTFSINEFTFNGTATSTPTVGVSANVTTLCTGGTINLTGTTNITGNFVAAQVNFESTANYTAVGGQTRIGNSATGDRPASVSFATSPTTSYSVTNGTTTVTSQNFTGLPSGATKTISMQLAAFSIGSTANGMDATDNVIVEISLDGGSTYSQEIQVNGNSNCYWGYTTATGVASTTYDGNNTATVFAPAGGGARTTDGYSTLQISLPTSATQVRVRVSMLNNSTGESWVIDDIKLTQSIVPTYSWTSVPAGFTSSLQNPTGVTVSGNTAYTLTATNPVTGCSNSSSVSITATPTNTPGTASSNPTLCINTALTNITRTTTGATGVANAGTAGANGLPAGVAASWNSNTITIFGTPSAAGIFNYSIPLTGGCGSVNATGTITVSPVSVGGTIAGTATVCSGTNSTSLTLSGYTGSITKWQSSTSSTFASAVTDIVNTTTSQTASNLTATTYYRAVVTSGACAAANSATVTITVNPPTPATPGDITGTAVKCPGLTGQVYSISAVTNATSYNWTVPTGWSISAGAGTASITVTTGSAGQNGNISVTAQNSCGTSSDQTLAVTVSPAAPATPVAAAGSNTACSSISANWTASANATTYFLDVSTSNTFSSFVGAYNNLNVGNVTTISVTGLTAGVTYYYHVRANNSCGTSASSSVITYTTLPATPAAPTATAGSNVACTSISANWNASTNATTYFLDVSIVSNFASFVTGFNNLNVGNVTSYSVTGLLANTTYYYRIRANNSCGTSGNSSSITYATSPVPAQPSSITGTLNPEIGLTQAYSVTNVAGVSYAWSFSGPNGWSVASGQGSNAIVANVGTANTTITVVPSNTCGNGTSRTIATTIPQYRARFISANYGTSPWCQGESRSISVVVKNTGVASWTNAAPDVNIGARWNANGANWTDFHYRMDANNLAPGATQTYTFASMQSSNALGFGSYNTPPTYVSSLNTGNNNIIFDIVKEADCWFSGNGGTCGPGNALYTTPTIVISASAPAQPGAITGTAVKCPGLTGQVYSIAGVANASTYNWLVPTGWSITANTGTSITVTTGTSGQNGNISVTAQNSCGTSIARTLAVTVSAATPAAATAAAGSNAACTTISANWAASANATTYLLDVSTVNTFASFVGAFNNLNVGNVTTVSVTGLTAGVTYYYRVRANNSCGTSANSATITYATTPATPAQPGTITGTTAQCATQTGQVYSIAAIANATTYNWTVPTGWTITAGSGTTSITVTTGNAGQNGNISVTSQNSCGASSARTLAVTVTANPTVNVGSGLAAICAGGSSAALGGSVTSPATAGTWTSSAGGTFNPNATNLNATWTAPASYLGTATLTLTSSGGICGTATNSKSITVNPLPADAGTITGTSTVCQSQSGVTYSIASLAYATSYTWSYSGTGFTASGSTASIFGSFSASATSGNLTVRGVNSCGNGVVSATYAITVNSAPSASGVITGSPSLCQGQTGVAYSVAPIAGASSYLWSYSGTGFTPSGTTASITADFSASATAGTLTVRGVNSCGNGVASANYNISVAQLPGTPGTILGPSTVCKGQAGFTFTIPAIANATSYNWVYTGTGVTFSGNTASVTATVSNTATSGVIKVRGVSACLNGVFSANFPVTVLDAPTISISSNYCGNPGFVILTASSGFSSYLWSTGATTSFVNADIAGQFTVTGTSTTGCKATASVGVATELCTNGSFNAGNTGFTTNYTYVTDGAGQGEMYPEGTYAVVPNSNTVHSSFYGTGHTPSGGNYMVVNGSPALGQNVWSQNDIVVQPNTTYYFSAWGLSVVNGNNAVLRFSINGSQVGSIASLPNGYSSTAGPFNWVRFYGSWNSGFATEADLSIINLNTILGGNDFGLDDVSFGTLSPVALSVAPSTIIGTTVCQGDELVLNANAIGGASPFTYLWTGPNGFTSTLMNPTVTASSAAVNAGTYTLTVTDGFGCSATSNVVVTISALPLNRTPVATAPTVCVNGSTTITLATSQTGISYQLRNDANDSHIGDPIAGTGGTITFSVDNLLATTTYNVSATGALTQCSVEMPTTVTITVAATPVLAITNQAVCSGTVDLTAAGVTAGSTGSGTLSYWTDAAATSSLASPTSVATSGIYYIQSNVGTCEDIEPVTVSITTTPITGFTYPTSPYCSSELDPAATMNASAVAGVFSCTNAALIFFNTSTGVIDLSASTAGTYTVRNTVSPSGGCPSVSSTSTVVITGAPLTDFSYDAGNDFCQVYSAANPTPVFAPGAAAGTFASTFGLSFISTSTGVVNLASSTPGNYAIWNTRPAVGGCLSESDTVFIDINPYVFAGSVNTSISDDIICLGETIDLFSQTSAYSSVLLRERFNGAINNWSRANSSVGGTVLNAAWTLRADNYIYNLNNFRSNDNTQFYMSNSEAQAGTTTLTTLRSPSMSTVGYTNLNLDFFHHYNGASIDTAQVQVSLNNSTWTTVASYTTNQGNRTGFTNPVINLNAYIGQPIFYVRFRYTATNDKYWAIDNVSLTGNCTKYNYNWASAPAGFTSTSANPLNVAPAQNSFYVVNATNTFGCSNPSSPLPITVNALPILTSSLTPPAVCGNEVFTYVPASTPSSSLISWTRPIATGITNAAITAAQSGNPSETLANLTNSDKNVIYNFTLDNNGCSQVVPVTVVVKPIPVIDLGLNLSVCNGSPAQLNTTISNGLNVSTFSWSPSTGLSSNAISDPTATISTATQNYAVTVQSTNGCSSTSSAVSVTNVGFGGTPGLWIGSQNSNWDDCRNWSDGKIPTSVTNVTVDGNALNDIQISGSQQCNNLFFSSNNNSTRTVTLIAGSTLQASGDVAVLKSAGTGSITLRVMNNATLSCNNLSILGSAPGAGNAIVQKDMVNTTINVNGSLSIDPGAHLDMNDGNNGTSEGMLTINANFVNNANAADFNVGNVDVIFNGSALQTITCPANQDFGKITLNNSSLAGVRLNNNISVSRGMEFINGVLDLNLNTLTLGSNTVNAVITGSGNNSYILVWDGSDNGTVIHHVNNTGFNYLFPIGDLNEYTPFNVNLSSATLSNATITAKLNGTVNPNIVGSTNYLGRFWSIEPSGITNPVYSVQYSYSATDIVGSDALLFPAKYNSGGWQSCNGSASNAMIGTGSNNAGTRTLSWAGITTFSEFTAIGNGSPLPIELLDFNAACDGSKVNISWTTASESNNKQFIIEESNDAKNWVVVKTEMGAGNSNTLRNYAVSVNANYSNGTYYRLTQVDYNGDSETFDPIYVNCDVKVSNEINIYPVPAYEVSNLDIQAAEDMDIQITLFSSTGQILLSQKTALKKGNNIIKLDIANLSPGMYHVNIVNDKKIEFSGSRSIIKR